MVFIETWFHNLFLGLSLVKEDSLGLGRLASLWCRFEGRYGGVGTGLLFSPSESLGKFLRIISFLHLRAVLSVLNCWQTMSRRPHAAAFLSPALERFVWIALVR